MIDQRHEKVIVTPVYLGKSPGERTSFDEKKYMKSCVLRRTFSILYVASASSLVPSFGTGLP